jgi:hypothetical protein
MRRVLVVVAALSGCTTWRVIEEQVELRPNFPQIAPRRDELPGTAHVIGDGSIRYAIDLDTACMAVTRSDRVRHIARRKTLTTAGFVAIGGGLALVGLTPLLSLPTWFMGVGFGVFLGTVMQLPGKHSPADHTMIVERDAVVDTANSPCTGVDVAAAFGDLALTAPWGERASAPVDATGGATFEVDWRRAGDEAPGGLWHIEAASQAVADFALSPADRIAARAQIDAVRDRR